MRTTTATLPQFIHRDLLASAPRTGKGVHPISSGWLGACIHTRAKMRFAKCFDGPLPTAGGLSPRGRFRTPLKTPSHSPGAQGTVLTIPAAALIPRGTALRPGLAQGQRREARGCARGGL